MSSIAISKNGRCETRDKEGWHLTKALETGYIIGSTTQDIAAAINESSSFSFLYQVHQIPRLGY